MRFHGLRRGAGLQLGRLAPLLAVHLLDGLGEQPLARLARRRTRALHLALLALEAERGPAQAPQHGLDAALVRNLAKQVAGAVDA